MDWSFDPLKSSRVCVCVHLDAVHLENTKRFSVLRWALTDSGRCRCDRAPPAPLQ